MPRALPAIGGHVQVTFRVPVALRDRLASYARASRVPQQELVEEALTKILDELDPAGKHRPVVLPPSEPADRLGALEQQMAEIKQLLTRQHTGRK